MLDTSDSPKCWLRAIPQMPLKKHLDIGSIAETGAETGVFNEEANCSMRAAVGCG